VNRVVEQGETLQQCAFAGTLFICEACEHGHMNKPL